MCCQGNAFARTSIPAARIAGSLLAGTADYILDAAGSSRPVAAGDVVVAHSGQVHGAVNRGNTAIPVCLGSSAGCRLSGAVLLAAAPCGLRQQTWLIGF